MKQLYQKVILILAVGLTVFSLKTLAVQHYSHLQSHTQLQAQRNQEVSKVKANPVVRLRDAKPKETPVRDASPEATPKGRLIGVPATSGAVSQTDPKKESIPGPSTKTLKSGTPARLTHPMPEQRVSNQSFTPSPATAKKSVNQLFRKFNSGSNTISGKYVIGLAKRQDISGSEAALLSVLIRHEVGDSSTEITNRGYKRGQLLSELNNKNSGLYKAYLSSLNRINATNSLPANQKLFGPNGLTAQTNIHQQYPNDCYFLAPINSILRTPGGPQKIASMITPIAGQPNQFNVKFPGSQHVIKVRLTDTDLAMYSTLAKGGQWLAILSAAESKLRGKLHLGQEAVLQPGYELQTMPLLTGQKYQVMNFAKANQSQIFSTMQNALNNSQPIGVVARRSNHYLSLIGYDKTTNSYTFKNPWGTTELYNPLRGTWSNAKNPPKKGTWFAMKEGVFTVPASEITTIFNNITYQVPATTNVSKPTN